MSTMSRSIGHPVGSCGGALRTTFGCACVGASTVEADLATLDLAVAQSALDASFGTAIDFGTPEQPAEPAGSGDAAGSAEPVRSYDPVPIGRFSPEEIPAPPILDRDGFGYIDNTIQVHDDPDRPGTIVHNIGGVAHLRVRTDLAATTYLPGSRALALERIAALRAKGTLSGTRVTIMQHSRTSGSVTAREGTLMALDNGQIMLVPKGTRMVGVSRIKGSIIDTDSVLDVEFGYGGVVDLNRKWHQHKNNITPRVDRVDPNQPIADVPVFRGYEHGEPPSEVSAAFLIQQPNFSGGKSPAVFLATDQQVSEDNPRMKIVSGYFWTPSGSGLESESGSFYAHELAERGGRISDFEPGSMQFSDGYKRMPSDLTGGIRYLLGASESKRRQDRAR